MIKIVNGLQLHLPDDITRIRVRHSNDLPSIERYSKSMVVTGDNSNSFQMLTTVITSEEIKTINYEVKPLIFHLGGINIEAYSCLPVIITVAVIDRKDFKYVETEGQLIIACPKGTKEQDLVDYFHDNPLTYYNISGGSSKWVGNVVLYELSQEVTRDYDAMGTFVIDQYKTPTIDSGEVMKAFNRVVKETFPDFSYVKFGDQDAARQENYIEYTLIDFGKYRRPYVEELTRRTLFEQFRVKLEFVIKDTIKYMNILHDLRAVELLTNIGTFQTIDKNGNSWKCSIDWGEVISDTNPGQVRGSYGKQAGQSIVLEGQIRFFSIPDNTTQFYEIETVNTIYKFIISK